MNHASASIPTVNQADVITQIDWEPTQETQENYGGRGTPGEKNGKDEKETTNNQGFNNEATK